MGFIVGAIEDGVEHLALAIAVCNDPEQLVSVLNDALPDDVMELIYSAMPEAKAVSLSDAYNNECMYMKHLWLPNWMLHLLLNNDCISESTPEKFSEAIADHRARR